MKHVREVFQPSVPLVAHPVGYTGSGSLILAIVLLIVTGVLLYCALRLYHPITAKRPGKFVGISIVALWVLSATMFVVAVIVYVLALYQQSGHLSGPTDPITPVRNLCLFSYRVHVESQRFLDRGWERDCGNHRRAVDF
jgi:hypothetical protein